MFWRLICVGPGIVSPATPNYMSQKEICTSVIMKIIWKKYSTIFLDDDVPVKFALIFHEKSDTTRIAFIIKELSILQVNVNGEFAWEELYKSIWEWSSKATH